MAEKQYIAICPICGQKVDVPSEEEFIRPRGIIKRHLEGHGLSLEEIFEMALVQVGKKEINNDR